MSSQLVFQSHRGGVRRDGRGAATRRLVAEYQRPLGLSCAVFDQEGDACPTLMSIVATNWAWGQQLTPTVKFVLLALADSADDHGVCWPSVQTVARKCGVSSRTVQCPIRNWSPADYCKRMCVSVRTVSLSPTATFW